jgi:hypothetical protein
MRIKMRQRNRDDRGGGGSSFQVSMLWPWWGSGEWPKGDDDRWKGRGDPMIPIMNHELSSLNKGGYDI